MFATDVWRCKPRRTFKAKYISILLLVVILVACTPSPRADTRALEGTRPGYSLEEAISDFDISVPDCALNDDAVFRAPPGRGLNSPWLYIRLRVSKDCLPIALEALGINEAELRERDFHWIGSVPAAGGPADSVPSRVSTSLLDASPSRGELLLRVSVEEFQSVLYLHAIATL
jgi:hypothetical protein